MLLSQTLLSYAPDKGKQWDFVLHCAAAACSFWKRDLWLGTKAGAHRKYIITHIHTHTYTNTHKHTHTPCGGIRSQLPVAPPLPSPPSHLSHWITLTNTPTITHTRHEHKKRHYRLDREVRLHVPAQTTHAHFPASASYCIKARQRHHRRHQCAHPLSTTTTHPLTRTHTYTYNAYTHTQIHARTHKLTHAQTFQRQHRTAREPTWGTIGCTIGTPGGATIIPPEAAAPMPGCGPPAPRMPGPGGPTAAWDSSNMDDLNMRVCLPHQVLAAQLRWRIKELRPRKERKGAARPMQVRATNQYFCA